MSAAAAAAHVDLRKPDVVDLGDDDDGGSGGEEAEEGEGAGGGLDAVAQLQPRPVMLHMMTLVLQLAHAAAAMGEFHTAAFCRGACAFTRVTPAAGAAFNDVLVPLMQDGVRDV